MRTPKAIVTCTLRALGLGLFLRVVTRHDWSQLNTFQHGLWSRVVSTSLHQMRNCHSQLARSMDALTRVHTDVSRDFIRNIGVAFTNEENNYKSVLQMTHE